MAKSPRHAPFWIKPVPKDAPTWDFIRQMEKRGAALIRMVPYTAAVQLRDGLLDRIPKKADYEEYRNSLGVAEVSGGKKGRESAFALRARTRARKIKKTDVRKTVIYVRQNKARQMPEDLAIKILSDNGPWTADTIPFWPKKSEAVVIQRKVTAREADAIARDRKKDWPKVRRELGKIGRRMPARKKGPGQIKRKQKAIPDLAMLALSLEFGTGGRRAVPAWRKTLREIKVTLKRMPKQEKHISRTWEDPNYKGYKNWPNVNDEITPSVAATFKGFQDRLGHG